MLFIFLFIYQFENLTNSVRCKTHDDLLEAERNKIYGKGYGNASFEKYVEFVEDYMAETRKRRLAVNIYSKENSNSNAKNGLGRYIREVRSTYINPRNQQNGEGNTGKSVNLGVDSEGNELTDSQQDFYADSQVRDEEGRLLILYHGNDRYGFIAFDIKKNRKGFQRIFALEQFCYL